MGMDKKIEKKKGLKKKHIVWIIAALALVFLSYKVIFTDYSSVYRIDRDKLTISTVENSLFNDYITVIGQVEPISTIYLDVEEGGKVEEIFIEEGEMVKKGQRLARSARSGRRQEWAASARTGQSDRQAAFVV